MEYRFWGKKPGSSPAPNTPTGEAPPRAYAPLPPTRQAHTPEQLPKWRAVRTGDRGDLAIAPGDRRRLAVLQCLDGKSALVYAPGKDVGHAIAAMEARLRDAGEARPARIQTTLELLQLIYDDLRSDADRGDLATESAQAQYLDQLLVLALERGASDIHVQGNPDVARILMRIHGDMHTIAHLAGSRGEAFARAIFRYAAVSEVDFNANDYQDAVIQRTIQQGGQHHELQLRFADLPVYPHGFDVTLRILRTGAEGQIRSLESLGYSPDQRLAFDTMLSHPTGIIVLCGKTNSGKSTTNAALASMLFETSGGTKLIRSIEDPPEVRIPGARQTPIVRAADGKSPGFARALRAAMRGDPDVILIGEVRDEETGRLAMEACMTGHKVLTTVHAASPFDAVDRLIDKGFRRQILAAEKTVNGVVYQRLVKLLCPACAISMPEDDSPVLSITDRPALDHGLLNRVRKAIPHCEAVRFRGPGCPECHETGIIGRSVAAEFLLPDREIQSMILADDRVSAQAYWRSHKWAGRFAANGSTALEQGIEKIAAGLMSPLDVETELGQLDSEAGRAQAADWLEAARRRDPIRSVR